MKLVLQPTDVAQWHALVSEAQHASSRQLDEGLESYLVFLLMRFCGQPEMARRIMALEFLQAQNSNGLKTERLRDVGDQCLLFSGLFPKIAEKRLVSVSYFVGLGRTAYHQLSECVDQHSDQFYGRLAQAFVSVMDVLHAMRGLSGEPVMDPLAAAELWSDTGSPSAFKILTGEGNFLPISEELKNKRTH
ncbi:hypothetical protein MNBD_GAMMA15-1591 [hydrothermal vent metagenome]|uniref:Uncharacterized protein n=1 Tax=hydrothermal vent metagenome TaxID=652676 RepID=A0A3B0YL00_9ZZZZ